MPYLRMHVDGRRVTLTYADPWIVSELDRALRYETALAAPGAPYSDLPGQWDGVVRLLRKPRHRAPWAPCGLAERIAALAKHHGYQVEVQDDRVRPEPGMPEPGVDFALRPYQREAVAAALKLGRGVIDAPPRSGKTRMGAAVVHALALPTLWIAPTNRIVEQTAAVLEGFFGRGFALHLVGSRNQERAACVNVVVCTAATAVRLDEAFFLSRQVVLVDEYHHSAAKSYMRIFDACAHVYHRYGMTGTYYRSGGDALAMHAHLSECVYRVTAAELMEREHLVPTDVVFLPVPGSRVRAVGDSYAEIADTGLYCYAPRVALIVHVVRWLVHWQKRVLVLVATKKQGRLLIQKMREVLPPTRSSGFDRVEMISTDTMRAKQTQILEAFLGGVMPQVLVGTSLVGEGVDLPTCDALVCAGGGKASVTLIQNAYRVCTATPEKTRALVVDFGDQHRAVFARHAKERLGIYHAEPLFKLHVLASPQEFAPWYESLSQISESLH